MQLPVLKGVIRRRLLVNFRVEPDVIQAQLPGKFRPKLQDGKAIAGICLIRLEELRPRFLPSEVGLSSENAAHRVAVLWDEDGSTQEGVFIPRRDSNSPVNRLIGGRLFPGEHHEASFTVCETVQNIHLSMESADGDVAVRIRCRLADSLPASSVFPSLPDASRFFEKGSLGYSLTHDGNRLDGLRLATDQWAVRPLDVSEVYSSYFSDTDRFPPGSVEFDHALLMQNVVHEWHNAQDLYI
jgi:hypothetical protein